MIAHIPDAVQHRLDPNERVEWCGQPRQGLIFRPIDGFIIPFSLVWAGLPAAAFVAAIAGGQFGAMLPLLLFVVPGIYITFGRFVVDIGVRKGLHYVVTDTRCMIIGTRWRRVTRTFAKGRGDYELVEHSNGLGTIRFVSGSAFTNRRNPFGDWFSSFEQIAEASEVYRLVRATGPSGDRPPHWHAP